MFDESLPEAWAKRYGHEGPEGNSLVSTLLSHRSVRRYAEEAIDDDTISVLIAAAQSAATSSNLQCWSVISVQEPERRNAITEAAGNQKQVLNAPLFLVFLADIHRIREYAKVHGIDPDGVDTVEMFTVGVVDATLAAERLVCAAESLGYGICYIGGIRNHPHRVKELLNLPENTFAVFGLCVGRPAESARADIKPRLRQDQVWFRETYSESLDSQEYDERMNEFFSAQGMENSVPWSAKSGQRACIQGLSGRETLLEFLQQQGFLKR